MTKLKPDQRHIDLFDEFTHGTMKRPNFAQRMPRFSCGAAVADPAWGGVVEYLKRYLAG